MFYKKVYFILFGLTIIGNFQIESKRNNVTQRIKKQLVPIVTTSGVNQNDPQNFYFTLPSNLQSNDQQERNQPVLIQIPNYYVPSLPNDPQGTQRIIGILPAPSSNLIPNKPGIQNNLPVIGSLPSSSPINILDTKPSVLPTPSLIQRPQIQPLELLPTIDHHHSKPSLLPGNPLLPQPQGGHLLTHNLTTNQSGVAWGVGGSHVQVGGHIGNQGSGFHIQHGNQGNGQNISGNLPNNLPNQNQINGQGGTPSNFGGSSQGNQIVVGGNQPNNILPGGNQGGASNFGQIPNSGSSSGSNQGNQNHGQNHGTDHNVVNQQNNVPPGSNQVGQSNFGQIPNSGSNQGNQNHGQHHVVSGGNNVNSQGGTPGSLGGQLPPTNSVSGSGISWGFGGNHLQGSGHVGGHGSGFHYEQGNQVSNQGHQNQGQSSGGIHPSNQQNHVLPSGSIGQQQGQSNNFGGQNPSWGSQGNTHVGQNHGQNIGAVPHQPTNVHPPGNNINGQQHGFVGQGFQSGHHSGSTVSSSTESQWGNNYVWSQTAPSGNQVSGSGQGGYLPENIGNQGSFGSSNQHYGNHHQSSGNWQTGSGSNFQGGSQGGYLPGGPGDQGSSNNPGASPGPVGGGNYPSPGPGSGGNYPVPGPVGGGNYPAPSQPGGGYYPPSGPVGGGNYPPVGPAGGGNNPPPGPVGGGNNPPTGPVGGGNYPAPGPVGGGNYPPPSPVGGGNNPPPGPVGGGNNPPTGPVGGGNYPAPGPVGGGNYPPPGPVGGGNNPPPGPVGGGNNPPTSPVGGGNYPAPGPIGGGNYPGTVGSGSYPPPGPVGGGNNPPSGPVGGGNYPAPGPVGGGGGSGSQTGGGSNTGGSSGAQTGSGGSQGDSGGSGGSQGGSGGSGGSQGGSGGSSGSQGGSGGSGGSQGGSGGSGGSQGGSGGSGGSQGGSGGSGGSQGGSGGSSGSQGGSGGSGGSQGGSGGSGDSQSGGSQSGGSQSGGSSGGSQSGGSQSSGSQSGGSGQSSGSLQKHCQNSRGQFPSPNGCNKFINCWDGVAIEQQCPSGLVFSNKGPYCDYPANVNCDGRGGYAPPPSPPGCGDGYGSYRNPQNCSEFFICNAGVPIKFSCPAGTLYSESLKVCDYQHKVSCANQGPQIFPQKPQDTAGYIKTINPVTSQPESNSEYYNFYKNVRSCQPGSVYKVKYDCTSVSLCRSGYIEQIYCPEGTAYDIKAATCISSKIAKCFQ